MVCSSQALIRLAAYLESLDSPVALIAGDHTVLCSNGHFRRAFDRHDRKPARLKIGEALDCKSVTSQGRCGETATCLHCDIKRSIELSRITGEKLPGILTSIQKRSGADITCRISTEKAGEAILLTLIEARQISGQGISFVA